MEKEFTVTIEETVSDVFIVKAESLKDAVDKVSGAYRCGSIILEPGNLVQKKFHISDISSNEETEWVDF